MRPEGATAAEPVDLDGKRAAPGRTLDGARAAPGAGPTPKPSTPAALTADLRKRAQERIARTF